MKQSTRTLALLVAALAVVACLGACAAKDTAEEEPQVQVKGQYDVSVGSTNG